MAVPAILLPLSRNQSPVRAKSAPGVLIAATALVCDQFVYCGSVACCGKPKTGGLAWEIRLACSTHRSVLAHGRPESTLAVRELRVA
jgi:hypothetical protein